MVRNMQDLLLQPLFTVDLKHKKPGSYNFGYIDPLQFYGEISWTSASTADGHWIFHIVGYGVGENASVSEDWRAIADTETSVSLPHEAVIFIYHTNPYKKLFYIPSDVCNNYYSTVPGAYNNENGHGCVFPCEAKLPDFTFSLDSGYAGVLPGLYLNYSTTGANDGNCVGGIQNSDPFGISIVGDMLLKSQFIIFEGGDSPRLGFAAKHLESD
jgi:hypothetical protein